MADPVGGFGFLDQITDVSFGGGDWIMVFAVPAVHRNAPTNTTLTAAFPGLIGGTPGVPCLTNNRHPAAFAPAPHRVVAADLQRQVKTSSSRAFNSFGIWTKEVAPLGDSGTPADVIQCYIRVPAELKARGVPFIMRVFTTISDPGGSSQLLAVGTFRDKTIRPGYMASLPTGSGIGGEAGIVGFVNAGMSPLDPVQTFQIDPKTLSVTWL